jgi:hypothetical protein
MTSVLGTSADDAAQTSQPPRRSLRPAGPRIDQISR